MLFREEIEKIFKKKNCMHFIRSKFLQLISLNTFSCKQPQFQKKTIRHQQNQPNPLKTNK